MADSRRKVMDETIRPMLDRAIEIAHDNNINLVVGGSVDDDTEMLHASTMKSFSTAPLELLLALAIFRITTDDESGNDPNVLNNMILEVALVVLRYVKDELLLAKMVKRTGVESAAADTIIARYDELAAQGKKDEVPFEEHELIPLVMDLQKDLVMQQMSKKREAREGGKERKSAPEGHPTLQMDE